MSLTADKTSTTAPRSSLRSPLFWLVIAVAILPFVLLLRLTVPIGPMYWDILIYFDAANRIFNGQVPVVDFFVPVGPLGYYLFAGGLKLFPDAQPLLLVSWSMLAVTAPLMALVLWQGDRRRSPVLGFGLIVPFLIFALLPFNTREYFPYPGSDGFGIYNRQCCQLLYVLVAALVFVPRQRALAVIVTLAMTALFLTKITGFVAGFMICLFALVAGRVTFRHAAAAAFAFFAFLGALQVWNGMAFRYATDVLSLLDKNRDTLLPRFLHAGSCTFGIVAPAGVLALLLFWNARHRIAGQWRALRGSPSLRAASRLLDHDGLWLCVVLFAGVFFETQNTGSQALVFLWPVILSLVVSRSSMTKDAPGTFTVICLLGAAAVLPPTVHIVHRATRTYASALINAPLENGNLKTIGNVNARPDVLAHARDLLEIYANHRDTYRAFVENDTKPAFMYYLEYGFQLVHLMAIDRAISDIRALEASKKVHFDTIMELNFVDPIPYLMDRRSPKYIAIGADPTRAVPAPGSREEAAMRDTDLVLYPTCPPTTDNRDLYRLYQPALAAHTRIRLDSCFDAFVNPRLAAGFQ